MNCNKLELLADIEEIEQCFDRQFRYPSIYESPKTVEDGNENLLPIITSINPESIDLGIWGLLPQEFKGNWSAFQKVNKTTNVNLSEKKLMHFFGNNFLSKTAIIIVSSFYLYKYKDNTLATYLVKRKDNQPLGLAGTFTELSDGFLTCSILNVPNTGIFSEYSNLNSFCPFVLDKECWDDWLEKDQNHDLLLGILDCETNYDQLEMLVKSSNEMNSKFIDKK